MTTLCRRRASAPLYYLTSWREISPRRTHEDEFTANMSFRDQPHVTTTLSSHTCSTRVTGAFAEECQADFLKKWPQWNETDIMSLRDQFMIFDVNCDGLIDYPELSVETHRVELTRISRTHAIRRACGRALRQQAYFRSTREALMVPPQ